MAVVQNHFQEDAVKARIRTVYLAERESSLKIAARTLMVVIATVTIYTLCLATFGYRNA